MCQLFLVQVNPQKCLSKGGAPKFFHTYLLRHLDIVRPNQVWSTDISYIPMKDGFMYLYAVIDVYSRFIVGWRLSNTLSADNCYGLIEDCIRLYGAPEIVNSDQGSQYTTQRWEELLTEHDIKVSMDGRGRCKDNIWIERFWRTIKQEYVYLNPVDTVDELRRGIGNFIEYYNYRSPPPKPVDVASGHEIWNSRLRMRRISKVCVPLLRNNKKSCKAQAKARSRVWNLSASSLVLKLS